MCEPIDPWLVPDGFPSIGYIPINRPVSDQDLPIDPYVGLLPKYKGHLEFAPSTWGPSAYIKSFEKFFYKKPVENISKSFQKEWEFATWALRREYSFLRGSTMIPMVATDKNLDSTPALPKAEFYKTELDYVEVHGFSKYIEEYKRIQEGARPTPLWYLFLKKEILNKKKIRESDIRQILCTDPCFCRIGLMFEQHQNELMKERTHLRHGQCGWSPFEGGWDDLMRRLSRDGNAYIEMDWSRYDGTIPPEVFFHVKNIRFSFLSEEYKTKENRQIYRWYCDNLINRCVLLPSGEITKQFRGNPSGQVSTTMDNNMVNTFLQAFEFIYLNNLSIEDAKIQWENYDTIVYGDDRVTSTPLLPSDYKEKVIEMYENIFGMWVKPENVKIFQSLAGVSFCGFTNVYDGKFHLPVPTNVHKLVASIVTPTKKLQDAESLYGKILSMKVLMHNLPDDNPGKQFLLECELAMRKHMDMAGQPLVNFTTSMLDFLWRGGPKKS